MNDYMSHTHTHTNTHKLQILFQPLVVMRTWQSQDACALSRHCEPCKKGSWSQARNSQENRPFLTASGVGTQSHSHLDHCCFLRKGLEFAPQQMPGTQSQLGGLVGGHTHTHTRTTHTHTHAAMAK